MIFKNPVDRGQTRIGLSVYQGMIPSIQAGPTSAPRMPKAPSVAVAIKKGFYRRLDGEVHANIAILCWDDDNNRQGRIDVHNIINRIVYGLMEKNSTVDRSFILCQSTEKEDSIEFELVEDPNVDFFPYFLGWVSAKFGIMSPGPDDAAYNDVGADTLQWVGPISEPEIIDPTVNPPTDLTAF